MTDPQQLLREYVESSSDAAFRELVNRYINLVYSVALRRTDHDTRIAEDIAQTVFTDLAAKASTLPRDVMLGGWLHRHTCFVASNVLRSEHRRTVREQQALEMNMLHDDTDPNWKQLAPVLDDVIQELAPADRDAIVLRFFEQRDFRSVGAALGISDDTAQKRVSRALEKLRGLLVQRGATMGVVALGTALADRSILAAPSGLGATIADAIPLSGSGIGSRVGSSVTRVAMTTAIVGLLLIVFLHPDVSGKFRSLFSSSENPAFPPTESVSNELTNSIAAERLAKETNVSSPVSAAGSAPAVKSATNNVLVLTIVADDSGKPVPNVPVSVRPRTRGGRKMPKVIGNRAGIAEVPLFENTSELEITTQIDGFADTRLLWHPDRGQTIPSSYTIRLVRPVRIGGRVVSPEGEPVAGAKVGFNHREDPSPNASVESHNFIWIETKTDSEGRWQINRIAPEMIRRIYGSAEHPDYIETPNVSMDRNPELERALREGTHVFKLGKPMSIRGIVEDEEGNPIPDAHVLCGVKSMSGRRETKSLSDGLFTVKGVERGKTLLTAEAKGFAATTIPIEIKQDDQSFTLTLSPGKTLRMRVMDTQGNPVPKANVWLNTISQNLIGEDKGKTLVQATFDKRTDASGRIVWENAPDTELSFDIAGPGCMRMNGVKMRPTDDEHVITLQSALVVSGTVRDAVTGKDIPKFRVICGWPGQFGPHWSSFDRDWLLFEGGKFKHTFGDPLIWGMENPGYQVKIEAEGYAPYISRIMKPTEGEVELEILLQQAQTPLVTVLLPDGKPATLADVGFVSPQGRLELIPGGFNRENSPMGTPLSQTDRKGQFRLPGDDTITAVIMAHPLGCAERTPTELINDPVVYLQEWGRLEGTYRSGGKPVGGREFTLEFEATDGPPSKLAYAFSKRAKSDENGRFLFPQVLPGKAKLIMLIHHQEDEKSGSFTHEPLQEVVIEPGQTTTVDFGGSGYTVQARFTFSGGKPSGDLHVMGAIHTPYPLPPEEIRQNQQALLAWSGQPDIAQQLARVRRFNFAAQPDGTWIAENVSAGEYGVMVHAFLASKDGKMAETWGAQPRQVIIPAEPVTGTLDLGEIVLRASSPHAPR